MLTVSLLRHAKSSWDNPELDDLDRPLTKRGAKAAPEMARYIDKHNLRPDFILCSSAVRTRATQTLVVAELGAPPPPTHYRDTLYLAPPDIILEQVRTAPESARHVMVIGHNPGLHMLALQLVGQADRKLVSQLAREFPTAALAVFQFTVQSWNDIDTSLGKLIHFVTPRNLT